MVVEGEVIYSRMFLSIVIVIFRISLDLVLIWFVMVGCVFVCFIIVLIFWLYKLLNILVVLMIREELMIDSMIGIMLVMNEVLNIYNVRYKLVSMVIRLDLMILILIVLKNIFGMELYFSLILGWDFLFSVFKCLFFIFIFIYFVFLL